MPGAFGGVVDLLRRGRIVQVGDNDARFGSLCAEFSRQRLQPFPAPRGQDQFCAPAGQFARQRCANPRAGPGHQRPFAVKVTWALPSRNHHSGSIANAAEARPAAAYCHESVIPNRPEQPRQPFVHRTSGMHAVIPSQDLQETKADRGDLHRMDVPANAPQLPLKAVIYATDFSSCSQNAGKYASLLAGKFNADLLAAHAFVLTNPAMEAEAEDGPAMKSAQRKDLETALAAIARQFGEGLQRAVRSCSRAIRANASPASQSRTLRRSSSWEPGQRQDERGIVGSVAERILRAATGPSLTVGPAVPDCEPACAPFRRILFATGLSIAAARGAPYAVAMAQAFDASLDVLHVVNPEEVEHPDRFSEIQNRFYAALEELVPRQADEIRNPRDFVEVGSAHVRILETYKGISGGPARALDPQEFARVAAIAAIGRISHRRQRAVPGNDRMTQRALFRRAQVIAPMPPPTSRRCLAGQPAAPSRRNECR